jgi:catechol 2,3-dioxygenase-like lactoylglutathione lyase family enzyme
MLSECDLVAFIPTTNIDAARAFYIKILKFRLISEDQYALVVRANGIDIRITPVDRHDPTPYTILGWKVPDIQQTYTELCASGVIFERYPYVKDPSGIWAAPGGAKVAWFKDPDNNVLAIVQLPAK